MTTADAESAGREEQIVAFHLDAETYGIDIAMIQEIIRLPEITRVPRTTPDVEGVINLRGRIVPVVNLRTRLGLGDKTRPATARVIVVESPEGTVGLVVDGVQGVLCLPASGIESPSELVSGALEDHIRGVGKTGDKLIIMLNVANVLRRPNVAEAQGETAQTCDTPPPVSAAANAINAANSANAINRKAA